MQLIERQTFEQKFARHPRLLEDDLEWLVYCDALEEAGEAELALAIRTYLPLSKQSFPNQEEFEAKRQEFLATIRKFPENDVLRLGYADFIERNADELSGSDSVFHETDDSTPGFLRDIWNYTINNDRAHAAFIRAQIAAETYDEHDPQRLALFTVSRNILTEHPDWRDQYNIAGYCSMEFKRGFADTISLTNTDSIALLRDDLFNNPMSVITDIEADCRPGRMQEFCNMPELYSVRKLHLKRVNNELCSAIAASGCLQQLNTLVVDSRDDDMGRFDWDGAYALLTSPGLRGVKNLRLRNCHINPKLDAPLELPKGLERLTFYGGPIIDGALPLIANTEMMSTITHLGFPHCEMMGGYANALKALEHCEAASNLKSLDFNSARLSKADLDAVAALCRKKKIQKLSLHGDQRFLEYELSDFLRSDAVSSLVKLDLGFFHPMVGRSAAIASHIADGLLNGEHLYNLRELNLSGTVMGNNHLRRLAGTMTMPNLRTLQINSNPELNVEGVGAFLQSRNYGELEKISLWGSGLTSTPEDSAVTLPQAIRLSNMKRLKFLSIDVGQSANQVIDQALATRRAELAGPAQG